MTKDTFLYLLVIVAVVAVIYYVFKKPQQITPQLPQQPQPQPQPQPQQGGQPKNVFPIPSFIGGGSTGIDENKQLNIGNASKAEALELQNILLKKGYFLPKYGADGDYGNETKAAHDSFLQKAGSNDRSLKFARAASGIAASGATGTGSSFADWFFSMLNGTPVQQTGTEQWTIGPKY